MSEYFIPDDVAQFILATIDSVAQLEALLLLRADPRQAWAAKTLAARLYITEEQTAEILDALRAKGFVVANPGNPASYAYQP